MMTGRVLGMARMNENEDEDEAERDDETVTNK
jgi:hypothetical protein